MAQRLMDLVWQALEEGGMERLTLWQTGDGYRAEGRFAGDWAGTPATGRYEVLLSPTWQVMQVGVAWAQEGQQYSLTLRTDGAGLWQGPGGPEPALAGCTEVDIAWTPFTNTLPIRRLDLSAGEGREIQVVYIAPPALRPVAVRQRYTNLGEGRWCYENLSSRYTTVIEVDRHGFVVTYPGLFRRATLEHEG